MFIINQFNQTTRWFLLIYFGLLFVLLISIVEMALLVMMGGDPLTAVSIPWKLLAFNLLMVLAFVGRYLRPYLLTPAQTNPKPPPELNPLEIEQARIERWAKRGW